MLEVETEKEFVKIGNSLAVIIPREVTKAHHISEGDKVLINWKGPEITLTPKKFKPFNFYGIVKGGPDLSPRDFKNLRKSWARAFEKRWERANKK